jgi:predicted alpha/beta-fold hydrolase
MPLIASKYKGLRFLKNGHLQTILPNLFRKITFLSPKREEIDTPDNDFLELDWYRQGSKKLIILSHGLEGNSERTYMLGMAKVFYEAGYDALAWNFRSCGSKVNKQLRFYHSGVSDDLDTVIAHVLKTNEQYDSIILVGFSMGGNITLKYLGEKASDVSKKIKCAAVFSVPVDIASSSHKMGKFENKLYMARFIRKLKQKVVAKAPYFPEQLSYDNYHSIKHFKHFDDRYTAPIHGFQNAEDYWEKASSLPLLKYIAVPTLIVNAANDSFLGAECFPIDIAKNSDFVHLEIPESGGHVGFFQFKNPYWSEKRALEFCSDYIC